MLAGHADLGPLQAHVNQISGSEGSLLVGVALGVSSDHDLLPGGHHLKQILQGHLRLNCVLLRGVIFFSLNREGKKEVQGQIDLLPRESLRRRYTGGEMQTCVITELNLEDGLTSIQPPRSPVRPHQRVNCPMRSFHREGMVLSHIHVGQLDAKRTARLAEEHGRKLAAQVSSDLGRRAVGFNPCG